MVAQPHPAASGDKEQRAAVDGRSQQYTIRCAFLSFFLSFFLSLTLLLLDSWDLSFVGFLSLDLVSSFSTSPLHVLVGRKLIDVLILSEKHTKRL